MFEENVAFCRDRRNDEEMLRFQVMQGGHKFIIDNLHRFKAFMAFSLSGDRPRSKTSPPLIVNTMIRAFFDIITPRGYLVWLVWNHVGVISWKYSSLNRIMTTTEVAGSPIPAHITKSISERYGEFEYCRYFDYSGENRFNVYWVVVKSSGKIVIVEAASGWVGRWGYYMDVNWS